MIDKLFAYLQRRHDNKVIPLTINWDATMRAAEYDIPNWSLLGIACRVRYHWRRPVAVDGYWRAR